MIIERFLRKKKKLVLKSRIHSIFEIEILLNILIYLLYFIYLIISIIFRNLNI